MIALKLLGPVDVRAPDGRLLQAVLAKPKPLALLVYLAAARPRGLHSTDTLLALLWPEVDREHALAALRQALYALRGALEGDVIVRCGTSMLGIEPTRLWCDAIAFDTAIEAREYAAAWELYRGELLEGFHIPGTPHFERWLDRERARLATAAAGVVRTLSEEAERLGNLSGALQWTRELLGLVPDDECGLRRAIELYQRLGDRASAIRIYEEFTHRLEAEYGLQPSPESRSMITALRADAGRDEPRA